MNVSASAPGAEPGYGGDVDLPGGGEDRVPRSAAGPDGRCLVHGRSPAHYPGDAPFHYLPGPGVPGITSLLAFSFHVRAARPAPQRYLAHAPAALGSFLARSQMHLCPDSHRYMFTARARG